MKKMCTLALALLMLVSLAVPTGAVTFLNEAGAAEDVVRVGDIFEKAPQEGTEPKKGWDDFSEKENEEKATSAATPSGCSNKIYRWEPYGNAYDCRGNYYVTFRLIEVYASEDVKFSTNGYVMMDDNYTPQYSQYFNAFCANENIPSRLLPLGTGTNAVNNMRLTYYADSYNNAQPMRCQYSLTKPLLNIVRQIPGNVGLTWNNLGTNVVYALYRGYGGASELTLLRQLWTTYYTDTTVQNMQSYSYRLRGYRLNCGLIEVSLLSDVRTAIPGSLSAPTLTLARATANVGLTWTAVPGATGYSIYRGGVWYAASTSPWFTDTNVTAGNSYAYQVMAYATGSGATKYSARSNAVTAAITMLGTPTASVVRFTPNVGITWNAIPGATAYSVYRGNSPTALTWYAASANPWYTDNGVVAGQTWYYAVLPYRVGGTTIYGGRSAVVAATVY